MKKFLTLCLLLSTLSLSAQKPVIFDTDMGPDYDDAGAIAILHAYSDSGQAKILATIASTNYPGVAGVLNVFNTYFKRPGLPIAVAGPGGLNIRDNQHWTDSILANYPRKIKDNSQVPIAKDLYRKILAAQPDGSVTIITVGFLSNLSDLLNSGPDQFSKLNGMDLIKKKVKQLVSMAGRFPAGREFNVHKDAPASINVFEHWPSPIIFSGFEIGMKIKTGLPLIHNDKIQHSPVKDVFRISIPLSKEDSAGRMSWDETAVLVGIKGAAPWYRLEEGRIKVAPDGSNTWDEKGKGHFKMVEAVPVEEVQGHLNALMMHLPK